MVKTVQTFVTQGKSLYIFTSSNHNLGFHGLIFIPFGDKTRHCFVFPTSDLSHPELYYLNRSLNRISTFVVDLRLCASLKCTLLASTAILFNSYFNNEDHSRCAISVYDSTVFVTQRRICEVEMLGYVCYKTLGALVVKF